MSNNNFHNTQPDLALNHYHSAWNVKKWFSFRIRRSRASTFLATTLITFIAYSINYVADEFIYVDENIFEYHKIIIAAILLIPITLFIYFLTIVKIIIFSQRFRDMGYTPYLALLTIIPMVELWPLLARGDGGASEEEQQQQAQSSEQQIVLTKITLVFYVALMTYTLSNFYNEYSFIFKIFN